MNEFIVAAVAVAFTGLLFFIVYDHIKHREPNEVVTTPPPSLDDLAVSKRSTKTSLYRCGHYASSKYTVSIFSVLIERSCKENKLCPHCFIEQCKHDVIRCCVCGRAILPGQMVVLYSSKGFENIPSYAVKVDNDLIGCDRIGCCAEIGLIRGRWTENGFEWVTIKQKVI